MHKYYETLNHYVPINKNVLQIKENKCDIIKIKTIVMCIFSFGLGNNIIQMFMQTIQK